MKSLEKNRTYSISHFLVIFIYLLFLSLLVQIDCKKFKNHRKIKNKGIQEIKILTKEIKQPVVILPVQDSCNENFNYLQNGKDWECLCKTGREQSPIDLPLAKVAKKSNVKPVFVFKPIKNSNLIFENNLYKIKIDNEHPSDFNDNLDFENLSEISDTYSFESNTGELDSSANRIVTLDGNFQAQEIVFHTPSEHKLNGKRYDLEMQVIYIRENQTKFNNEYFSSSFMDYKEKSKTNKYAILSFLFYKKPGEYNKFFQDIDYFSFPTTNSILKNLYLPKLFYSLDDDRLTTSKPFSFYTYLGSLTTPPCTENVLHYVVSDPIPLATIVIDQFKNSLNECTQNTRDLQSSNGRAVFYYDYQ
jgi:carbonic anhydrase